MRGRPRIFIEEGPIPWRCSSATTPPTCTRAVVAWYYVAPGVAVLLAGQFLISTSRIWFARMGVGLRLRARLPRWPLSPTADGPAIVVGEVHHPVKLVESATPDWLMIPERGLYTGVAILGAVGSGKTSACMHPFARQLLSWHATNPGVQRSRRTSAPLTSRTRVVPCARGWADANWDICIRPVAYKQTVCSRFKLDDILSDE